MIGFGFLPDARLFSTMATVTSTIKNLADLQERLGDVPLNRIRFHPWPATLQDVLDVREREGVICELVEGVLVEKAMGYVESGLTVSILAILHTFVVTRNLGIVTGEAGTVELMPGLVRIPDVAFTSWSRLPGGRYPTAPIPRLAPDLAVEVLSKSNTRREMAVKRQDYFGAGVELIWEIDPKARTIAVYAGGAKVEDLKVGDVLDGGSVLAGFSLPLRDLFGELDRHG
jgi:Uma2 family endonuclease